MSRLRLAKQPSASRHGVILLIVISLLILFSLVGIAFVIYAEGQANIARIWREGENVPRPDMDPELLLSYFLGQLIYDTDNPLSALRGHGLVRNMYGPPGSTIPFNGTGRQHTPAPDDYYNVDYTNYAGGVPRDPNQPGPSSPNPPYTYPDFNHMYLAAQRAADGRILVPSYYRIGPNGQPITLRPDTRYHTGFPPLADPSGDVKNVADSPGFGNGPNDSIWIDIGFPVMTAPDGRKFKPLFAPLILDLDGRLNINVHGNIRGGTYRAGGGVRPEQGWSLSDQGLGPWEVSVARVITAMDGYTPGTAGPHQEARRLFIGDMDNNYRQTRRGRYDIKRTATKGPWGEDWHRLPDPYAITGPFYSPINGDANFQVMGTALPGFPMSGGSAPAVSCFPYYNGNFDGWNSGSAGRNNPMLYNFFMPARSYYNAFTRGQHFSPLNMQSFLLYGDSGSPSQPSEVFAVCPLSFGDPVTGPRTRRLVTTHSFDIDQPGVTPWLWSPPGVPPLQLPSGALYPTGQPIPPPPPGAIPPGSEFAPAGQALVAGLGRIHLNRDLPKGALPWYNAIGSMPGSPPGLQGLVNGWIVDGNQARKAIAARQQYAAELFAYFRVLTGAADPTTVQPGSPEFNALRWLAQLAVNIVDMIDLDDNMTPFNWAPGEWVFGTELPHLVINEVYAEVANDPTDPNLSKNAAASLDYKVTFWVELHNPLFSGTGKGGQGNAFQLANNATVRLQTGPGPQGEPPYPIYKLTVAGPNTNLRAADNVRGEPDPGSIKTEVSNYAPEPSTNPAIAPYQNPWPAQPLTGVDVSLVKPVSSIPTNTTTKQVSIDTAGGPRTFPGDNTGFYVLGPKYAFPPGSDPSKNFATLCVKDSGPAPPGQVRNSLVYEYPKANDPAQVGPHTVLLRRLCCPGLPPNPTPDDPNHNPALPVNPYVTVDYLENVPTHDGVRIDSNGPHPATPIEQRFSVGKNQPYAAHGSQVRPQKPLVPLTGQPQHTFFALNVQNIDPATQREKADPQKPQAPYRWPFDWLTFIDRPLISPVELLQTSGYKPHELTQQFMTGTDAPTGKPLQRFGHLAPWFDQNARIYRIMEYMNATSLMQWVPVGGRCTGQVNINAIWDPEVFRALAGRTDCNFFTDADVDNWFLKMRQARSPNGVPTDGDRPFLGFGCGNIEDTLFRADPADPSPVPPFAKRRMFEPEVLPPAGNGHPYIKYEFLKKLFNNLKTRSNVFAVWVTVGFFEVLDDRSPNRPPVLGTEIGRDSNRHKRHRMFAIIDRSAATVAFDRATGKPVPGMAGPPPFFIPSFSPVDSPGLALVDVPDISGTYEDRSWQINVGDSLVIDTGTNQEVVTVLEARAVQAADLPANRGPYVIKALFGKPHMTRFAISNAMLGNPGPQPRFDVRQADFQLIVRYFAIIE
jgi:hypothetical protein